jgi:S1-C subfamily serine protease
MLRESVEARRRVLGLCGALGLAGACGMLGAGSAHADPASTIARVKQSIVAVGTLQRTRNPPLAFLGTGFAVGDGTLIATNAHVLPKSLNAAEREALVVMIPAGDRDPELRQATRVAIDTAHDLVLLRIPGAPLPALSCGDSASVREGQTFLFTGFPIGNVLGPYAATHRAMVAAVTPIVIPSAGVAKLDAKTIRQLARGAFPVFQLDATAYPGNSGSPLYDPATAEVLGVVNMVFVKGSKEAALSHPSGITYAIPAAHVQALLRTIP